MSGASEQGASLVPGGWGSSRVPAPRPPSRQAALCTQRTLPTPGAGPGGLPPTQPGPRFLCLPGLSHPPQRGPAGWEGWASPGEGHLPALPPSPRGTTEGLGCPSSPRRLHQEHSQETPVPCEHVSHLGRHKRGRLSGLRLPGSQRCGGSRPVRPRYPDPGTAGRTRPSHRQRPGLPCRGEGAR